MSCSCDFHPRFALVQVYNSSDPEGNYWIVEKFNWEEHMAKFYINGECFYTPKASVNVFDDPRDVSHLRDRILN